MASRIFFARSGWLLLSLVLAATASAAASRTLERIKAEGVIHLGFRSGAAPFSFKVSGKIDIECGTTTIALSRMELVDFSVPIFVDGGSVLTRYDAKITRLADFDRKRVAVIPGTTTETALKRELAIVDAKAELVPVNDGAAGVSLLAAGKVDGYAGDRIVLISLRALSRDPSSLALLGADFSFEPYALVVRRDDPDFRLAVNRALVGLYRSGEIDTIFERWLGALGAPGPLLHSMFYLSTLPE